MRDPVAGAGTQGRLIFGGVLLFAALHGLLYAVSIPAWDLFDEEQHLSYALSLADEQTIPEVDDPIQPRIIDSAVATDRWSSFRIGRPPSFNPREIGLEGLAYEGYQPPLYYLAIAPLTVPPGDDAWWELYYARLFGVVLLIAFAGMCWAYARDWLGDADPLVWGSVAVASVAVPSVAAAAGRVNNDLMAGLLLALGTLVASRLLEERRLDTAIFLGLLNGAAVLTKSHGAVLLLVTAVALWMLLARRQATVGIFAASLLPGIVALLGWGIWTEARYGEFTGAGAFLDLTTPFESLGPVAFVEELWLNAWSSYWGAYDGGTLRWITGALLLVALIVGLAGLLIGSRPWQSSPEGRQRLLLTGTLAVGLVAALWIANDSGLTHPHGRMLIGLFPALATLTIAGFRRMAGEIAAVQVGMAVVALSGVYYLFWFVPFFY